MEASPVRELWQKGWECSLGRESATVYMQMTRLDTGDAADSFGGSHASGELPQHVHACLPPCARALSPSFDSLVCVCVCVLTMCHANRGALRFFCRGAAVGEGGVQGEA